MELHAYTRTISDLFSVKKKYIVPRFQREYSWTKEQVSELWNDIIANISINEDGNLFHTEYFIGSLVLVGDDKSISLQIVDGQQRLTTLTILLSALCQRFLDIDKKNIAESIYNNYIAGKDDEGENYFKLENENPKPFFQTTIQYIEKEKNTPSSEEEKFLLKSYEVLYSYTSIENLKNKFTLLDLDNRTEYEKLLKAIRDQVVKYLKVIFITVNDEDEAYTIFETLNARGMNLSFVDLIKNKVFKYLNEKHPDDSAKTKWKKLRKKIVSRDDIKLETFIRHWWISRYAYVSAANVYKSFKNKWNNEEIESSTFLDEINSDADLYLKIASPMVEDFKQQEEKNVYRSLNALKIFNVIQQRPFILSLFKAKERKLIKLSELTEILSFIEKFHFLFNAVCSMRPSGIEGSYSKAARHMFEAQDKATVKKIIDELKKQLIPRLPDKEIFKDKFSKRKFIKGYTKDKKLIQYIFSYLESFKQTTSEFQPGSITLEHILSQSEGNKDYIGSIGNLLPLGSELNEKADNKKITQKLEIYKKSQFCITQEFAMKEVKEWGEKEIQSRTSELAEYCYDHAWKIIQ